MSSSPASTSVGTEIRPTRSVVSWVWIELQLGEVRIDGLGIGAISASNSCSSSSRSSKNGTVNAHSVTSRMTNGTPITGAMSAHIENMREQNGPGAA